MSESIWRTNFLHTAINYLSNFNDRKYPRKHVYHEKKDPLYGICSVSLKTERLEKIVRLANDVGDIKVTVSVNAKSYVSTFATNVFIQVCTVLQGILLARILGPDGRGEYAAIILWPSLFAGLGILGVDMAMARLAGKSKDPRTFVQLAVLAALVTGGTTALLCGFSLPYLIPKTLNHILPVAYLFILFIPINHVMMNLQGIDLGIGNFTLLNFSRAILYPVYLLGIILSWLAAHDKVYWCIVALIFANTAAVAFRIYNIKKAPLLSFIELQINDIFRDSIPFFCANVLTILYQQIDKMLLVWLLPTREIGCYTVALSAGTVLNSLNQALGTVTFSNATRRPHGTGFPALAQILRRGTILSAMGAVALGAALPFLLPLVYGHEFVGAVTLALLLLPGVTLASLGGIVNQDLRGQGKPIAGVAARVLGLLVIACIGWYLARQIGAVGIAWGFMAGEAVSFTGLLFVSMRFYCDADIRHLVPRKNDLVYIWQRIVAFAHQ